MIDYCTWNFVNGEIPHTAHGAQITPPPFFVLFLFLCLFQVRLAQQGYDKPPQGMIHPKGLEKVRLKSYYDVFLFYVEISSCYIFYGPQGPSHMEDVLQDYERSLVRAPLRGQNQKKGKHPPLILRKKTQKGGGYLCSKCKTRDCPIMYNPNRVLKP